MCVWQVLAVCVIHWERVRGCRSSAFLFFFWLLGVLCSLIPLHEKIQLAVHQVREMTLTQTPQSKPLQFHGTFSKSRTDPSCRNIQIHLQQKKRSHVDAHKRICMIIYTNRHNRYIRELNSVLTTTLHEIWNAACHMNSMFSKGFLS